jgi:hypothetical protein
MDRQTSKRKVGQGAVESHAIRATTRCRSKRPTGPEIKFCHALGLISDEAESGTGKKVWTRVLSLREVIDTHVPEWSSKGRAQLNLGEVRLRLPGWQ